MDDELLAHMSPAHSENIGLFGTITVDIDAELAQLDPHRPPTTATASAGRRADDDDRQSS